MISCSGQFQSLIAIYLFRSKVTEFFQLGKDLLYTLLGRLFICLDNYPGIFRLFVRIIYPCEVFDFALVNKLVETLDITLATDFQRALDIDFEKIADLLSRPLASFTIRCDS